MANGDGNDALDHTRRLAEWHIFTLLTLIGKVFKKVSKSRPNSCSEGARMSATDKCQKKEFGNSGQNMPLEPEADG